MCAEIDNYIKLKEWKKLNSYVSPKLKHFNVNVWKFTHIKHVSTYTLSSDFF